MAETREGNGNLLQYSCLENPMDGGAWRAAVHGVTKSRTRLSDFTFTFHFHALEKKMGTHSSILAWRIPGKEEPSGLLSMGSSRVRHDWSNLAAAAAWLKQNQWSSPLNLLHYHVFPDVMRSCWQHSTKTIKKKNSHFIKSLLPLLWGGIWDYVQLCLETKMITYTVFQVL